MHQKISCDYLVVGAGAMGLAFVDELHRCRPSDTFAIVDRRGQPGGHWNDAYPYVSLHQPAAFYGVNSLSLGPGGAALASHREILAYYETVLKRLLASGRVQYFPQHSYTGGGRFESLLTAGATYQAEVSRKIVDSTYMKVEVPSTTPPKYDVADAVRLVPPNALPRISEPVSRYVVLGAGKTGMDAVLFLRGRGVPAEKIMWVVSNDAWLLDRDALTPGRTLGWFVKQLELITGASTLEDVFLATEEAKSFMRIDPSVWPTKFRCATVNREELATLRSIENVVRLGRVSSLEPDRIVLAEGEVAVDGAETLFVDCTANALAKRERVPIFEGDTLTLQSVFMCQQVFSAALLGYVESRPGSDEEKNALCVPVPHPELNLDYLSCMATSNQNFDRWQSLFRWLRRSRLALPHHESLPQLFKNVLRARKIGPPALATIERILEAEGAAA